MAGKLRGGLVHRADATAHMSSLSKPTRRYGTLSQLRFSTSRKSMGDPVKAAGAMLKRGGK